MRRCLSKLIVAALLAGCLGNAGNARAKEDESLWIADAGETDAINVQDEGVGDTGDEGIWTTDTGKLEAKYMQDVDIRATEGGEYEVESISIEDTDETESTAKSHVWEEDERLESEWHIGFTGAMEAWKKLEAAGKKPGEGTIVAVVDTGINTKLKEFEGNLWINEAEADGLPDVDDDGNGYVDDIYGPNMVNAKKGMLDTNGHGTEISGIIAMAAGNGGGVGMAYGAKIMPVKVSEGSSFSVEDTIEGIRYAVDNGADIINLSCGTYEEDEEFEEAVKKASEKCILVAAAGNEENASGESVLYPAAYPDVIGVTSCGQTGELSYFTNWDGEGTGEQEANLDVEEASGEPEPLENSDVEETSGEPEPLENSDVEETSGETELLENTDAEEASGEPEPLGNLEVEEASGQPEPLGISEGGKIKKIQPAAQKQATKAYDIAAPGERILSVTRRGAYRTDSGTSQAAAIVSGALAILRGMYPDRQKYPAKLLKKAFLSAMKQESQADFLHGSCTYPLLQVMDFMDGNAVADALGKMVDPELFATTSPDMGAGNPWEDAIPGGFATIPPETVPDKPGEAEVTGALTAVSPEAAPDKPGEAEVTGGFATVSPGTAPDMPGAAEATGGFITSPLETASDMPGAAEYPDPFTTTSLGTVESRTGETTSLDTGVSPDISDVPAKSESTTGTLEPPSATAVPVSLSAGNEKDTSGSSGMTLIQDVPDQTAAPDMENGKKKSVSKTIDRITYRLSADGRSAYVVSAQKSIKNAVIKQKITISGSKVKIVRIQKEAFHNCKQLKKLKLPATLKTIGPKAFQGCVKLRHITVPKSVNRIGREAFHGDRLLAEVIFKSSKRPQIGRRAFAGTAWNGR